MRGTHITSLPDFDDLTKPFIKENKMGIYNRVDMSVTVKKSELLDRLKTNRQNHEDEYNEAIVLWRKDLSRTIEEIHIKRPLACSEFPKELIELKQQCPTRHLHLEDYDHVIDMFEMSTKEEIELSGQAFANYCRDDWDWKETTYENFYMSSVRK